MVQTKGVHKERGGIARFIRIGEVDNMNVKGLQIYLKYEEKGIDVADANNVAEWSRVIGHELSGGFVMFCQ